MKSLPGATCWLSPSFSFSLSQAWGSWESLSSSRYTIWQPDSQSGKHHLSLQITDTLCCVLTAEYHGLVKDRGQYYQSLKGKCLLTVVTFCQGMPIPAFSIHVGFSPKGLLTFQSLFLGITRVRVFRHLNKLQSQKNPNKSLPFGPSQKLIRGNSYKCG